jgi:hypothetical protein
MPAHKEIAFFSSATNWHKGVAWYERFFVDAPHGSVKGEASTDYTKFPSYAETAERIFEVLPSVKYIYCVRDPLERMMSHYRHEIARGREHRPPHRALIEEPMYLAASSYGMQLERHLRFTQPDRVLILQAEELRIDRRCAMRAAFGFLGVDVELAGYLDAPDLYTGEERLGAMGPALRLAEGQWTGPLRRRLSPGAKRRVRVALRNVTRRDHVEVASELSPQFHRVLEERLAGDQERFAELRRTCHS